MPSVDATHLTAAHAGPSSPVRSLPAQRSRRGRQPAPVVPLGSLTQQGVAGPTCAGCGSAQVTRLAMTLTDGTPVTFVSCHRCECRRWEHQGGELSVDSVLDRTRKLA